MGTDALAELRGQLNEFWREHARWRAELDRLDLPVVARDVETLQENERAARQRMERMEGRLNSVFRILLAMTISALLGAIGIIATLVVTRPGGTP